MQQTFAKIVPKLQQADECVAQIFSTYLASFDSVSWVHVQTVTKVGFVERMKKKAVGGD